MIYDKERVMCLDTLFGLNIITFHKLGFMDEFNNLLRLLIL